RQHHAPANPAQIKLGRRSGRHTSARCGHLRRVQGVRQLPRLIAPEVAADGRGRALQCSGHGPNTATLLAHARQRHAVLRLKLSVSRLFHVHTLSDGCCTSYLRPPPLVPLLSPGLSRCHRQTSASSTRQRLQQVWLRVEGAVLLAPCAILARCVLRLRKSTRSRRPASLIRPLTPSASSVTSAVAVEAREWAISGDREGSRLLAEVVRWHATSVGFAPLNLARRVAPVGRS